MKKILTKYRSFGAARQFVRGLKLKVVLQWQLYCKGVLKGYQKKPDDIPASPDRVFKGKGWKSFGDWLGTGRIATKNREYRSFDAARQFVRGLKINNQKEWTLYYKGALKGHRKKPDDIPANPARVFKGKGWKSFGDWLGTDRIANENREYRSFDAARQCVRGLKIKSKKEWKLYCKGALEGHQKKPDDIPASPESVFKGKGWKSFGDWVGTNRIATQNREYRSFDAGRQFVRGLKIKSQREWKLYCKGALEGHQKKPDDIPSNPDRVFKGKGWKSFGDWLGTDRIATKNRKYRSFYAARQFVRGLKLQGFAEWNLYCKGALEGHRKKPDDIPSNPDRVFKGKRWKSFGDWLGADRTANKNRKYRSFYVARQFVRGLKLKGVAEWKLYCKGALEGHQKKPDDIPSNPARVFKGKGWKSFGNWLGNRRPNKRGEYRSFDAARQFVRGLKIKNQKEWHLYCKGALEGHRKKPDDIPSNPDCFFKGKGWKSLGNWLGTGRVSFKNRKYRPFDAARQFVRGLKLKGVAEWHLYCKGALEGHQKKPDDIPACPAHVFKGKGWKSFGDWLGTGSTYPKYRKYRSFDAARQFVRGLNLKNQTEWKLYCKGALRVNQKKPDDIPACPEHVFKGKGWKSLGNWLGTGYTHPKYRQYRSFDAARQFVRGLKLKGVAEWNLYCQGALKGHQKKPDDIPARPSHVFKGKGWKSFGDWLGFGLDHFSLDQREIPPVQGRDESSPAYQNFSLEIL